MEIRSVQPRTRYLIALSICSILALFLVIGFLLSLSSATMIPLIWLLVVPIVYLVLAEDEMSNIGLFQLPGVPAGSSWNPRPPRINVKTELSKRELVTRDLKRLLRKLGYSQDVSGNSGIDIIAQPPGKRLQNVLLLSGGEKALTALALLIAIFRYRPSPICVQDEVDAPLDDANIYRFTKLIAELSQNTQFILITHNKNTMEIAPALYGVTMEEPGVSKIIGVDFRHYQQAKAS